MRETKEEHYTSTRTITSKTVCDLCNKVDLSEHPWRIESSNETEVEIRLKEGNSYRYGGHGEETTIDLCPDCFKTKLIPWIESQGGKPTIKEWDW